jgi:large subunit ribosomal protein L18
MNTQKLKLKRAERRRFRVRKSMYGTPQKPRLSVSRSNLHISAQLIDDLNGVTVASATSAGKKSGLKHGSNIAAAKAVGQKLAEAAKAKGITVATFDRGAFRFHGRIEALAVAATQAGLVCTDLESLKAKRAKAEAKPEAKPEGKGKGEGKPKGEKGEKGEGKPKGEKHEKGEGKPKHEGEAKPKGEMPEKGEPKPKADEKK